MSVELPDDIFHLVVLEPGSMAVDMKNYQPRTGQGVITVAPRDVVFRPNQVEEIWLREEDETTFVVCDATSLQGGRLPVLPGESARFTLQPTRTAEPEDDEEDESESEEE